MLRLPCCKNINDRLFGVMCEVLQQTQNLRSVHISQSKFQPGQLQQLLESLSANCGIETFEIFSSALNDDECSPLATFLETQDQLRSLKLSDNRIGSDGLRLISTALKNAAIRGQTLNAFHIGGNPVGKDALKDALFDLQRLTDIQSLGLRALGISDTESLLPLAEILQSPQSMLTDLQLKRNKLTNNMEVFVSGLQENTSLRVLELQECSLNNNDIYILANGLAMNPEISLRALNISGNTMTTETAKYIAKILVSCHKLTTFTAESSGLQTSFLQTLFQTVNALLSANDGQDQQTSEQISIACTSQIALTGLGLSNNQLDDTCAQILAPMIESGQLTSLDLSRNKLTGAFLQPFAASDHTKSRLKHLDLTGNRLGATGGQCLGQIIKKSPSLVRLFITDCSIPEKGLSTVADALRSNNVLQQMQYGGQSSAQNECGRQLRHQIDEKLRRNAARVAKNQEKITRIQSSDSMMSFGSAAFGSEAEMSSESIHRVQSMGTYELMDMDGLAGASVFGRGTGMRRGIGSCGILQSLDIPIHEQSNEHSQSIAQYVFDDDRADEGLSSSDYDITHMSHERPKQEYEQSRLSISQLPSFGGFVEQSGQSYPISDSPVINNVFSTTVQGQIMSFQIHEDKHEEKDNDASSKFQVQVQQKAKGRFQFSDNPV